MARTIKLSIVLLLVLCSVGCQSRCGNCGIQNGPFGGGLFQPVTTTVPAPSTYSLQQQQGARTARQQDYYTIPNTGQQPARQPTPLNNTNPLNNSNPNLSPQGWRQVSPNSNTQQQVNPTSLFVRNQNGLSGVQAEQVNPNYQTTVTDERQDPTRLAVTDASGVRAPARFFPTGSGTRLPQTPVATTPIAIPTSGYSQSQVASNTQPQNRATQINGSVVYQGAPNSYGSNPYGSSQSGNNPYGNSQSGNNQNFYQQARVYNPPVTSTAPVVLAQSTTERTASNVQAGWRDSQIPNVNR